MAWLKGERVGTLPQLLQSVRLLEAGIAQLRQSSKVSQAYLAGPGGYRLRESGSSRHFAHALRRITDATHRQNELRVAWIWFELAA